MSRSTPTQTPLSERSAGEGPAARGSLARQTLVRTGVGLGIVVVALTAISYYQVRSTVTRQALDDLRNYVEIRGEREQAIFDLAVDNHQTIKTELLNRIHDYEGQDPEEEFDRRYRLFPDGVVRSRRESFNAARMAGVAIMNPAALDKDLKRRVLAAQDTLEQMGRALHPRFQISWMVMPENLTLGYWPEHPEGPFLMSPKTDFTSGMIYLGASPKRNPARKSVWSGVYIDETSGVSVVSVSTPVYQGDRFIGIIGHDITLAELLHRTVNVRLPGTYNLIVERDGGLIAHPLLAGTIERRNRTGRFKVADSGDPALQSIYDTARTLQGKFDVLEDQRSHSYLGVVRIGGPEWYLITVYPKALLEAAAYRTARFVLLGGLISLVLETGILYLVLRRQVATPLRLLLEATQRVASGNMDVDVDAGRDDELGELATSFNQMAHAVREREAYSKKVEATLRESEERFRLLFERSADALLLLDEDKFVDCNEAALSLLGHKDRDGVLSRRLVDLSPEHQPDGSPSAEKAAEVHRIAFESGSHRFEWRARRADGEEVPVEALITAIPFRGKPMLFAVLRDITERKQAEEQNHLLTEEIAANLEREIEKNEQLRQLWATVEVLSAPVLEIWDDVLVLPIIGSVDDRRSTVILEKLLDAVVRMQSRYVILDVTGMHAIDASTADRLLKVTRAVRLLGARCILTGIRPQMAKTLVEHGVPFENLDTLGTLRSGLRECLAGLAAERARRVRLPGPWR